MSSLYAGLHLRDPQPMLGHAMQAWGVAADGKVSHVYV